MSTFFSTEKCSLTAPLTAVNVGHHGDCGFRSVAAGIMDGFLVHPLFNQELLSKILLRHFTYYPSHLLKLEQEVTSSQLMEQLISEVPLPQLIETMAYTLRQFAVDEMIANPKLEYSDIFEQVRKPTDWVLMRKHNTWMDKSSLLGLANALNIPIDIRVLIPGKELFAPPFSCNPNVENSTSNPKIMIELEGKQYRPRLENPNFFNATAYENPLPLIAPTNNEITEHPDFSHIMSILDSKKQHITTNFENTRSCLMLMVRAGELSKKRLLDVYIQYTGTYRSLPDQAAIQDVVSHSSQKTQDEEMVERIVMALAWATADKRLNVDDVFEQLEIKRLPSYKR